MSLEVTALTRDPIPGRLAERIGAVSLARSLGTMTSLGVTNPATMHVTMRITRERPEGMERVRDLLADQISRRPMALTPTNGEESLESISGIGPARARALVQAGVLTVRSFAAAANSPEGVARLSRVMRVSEDSVTRMRELATKLI